MASVSLSSTLPSPSFSCLHRQFTANLLSPQFNALAPTCGRQFQCGRRLSVAQTFDFSASFFESGLAGQEEDDDDSNLPPGSGGLALAVEEGKTEIQCPPGLRKYETMAVIRSDMTEDERLTLTQKYEEEVISLLFLVQHVRPVNDEGRPIQEIEEREKVVKYMWDVYTNSRQINLPHFWHEHSRLPMKT